MSLCIPYQSAIREYEGTLSFPLGERPGNDHLGMAQTVDRGSVDPVYPS